MSDDERGADDAAHSVDENHFSRRQILQGAAAGVLAGGGLGAGLTFAFVGGDDETAKQDGGEGAAPPTGSEEDGASVRPDSPLESFTVAEAETAEAVLARLIPSEDGSPGAAEGEVIRYIDRVLQRDAEQMRIYAAGLRLLDVFAEARENMRFVDLAADRQDAVLQAFEAGETEGDAGDTGTIPEGATQTPTSFFEAIREHALQGMFGDPIYGGNRDFVGWELLGYPGVKMAVPAEDQRIGVDVDPARRSAYAYESIGLDRASENGSHDG